LGTVRDGCCIVFSAAATTSGSIREYRILIPGCRRHTPILVDAVAKTFC
jgi:hypothetical protein